VLSSNTVFYKKIDIIINHAWWQTWWFRIIAILLSVILISLGILRYYRKKYQIRIRDLQVQNQIKTERERISKELHDNIGTQLSYISSNIDWMLYPPVTLTKQEETQRLSAVNNTAKEVIADLRETIWAMKKESVHLDELADRLKLLLQSQHLVKPRMDIKINEDIQSNTIFSPTEALNIFRICQEAIVNSVKHAEAEMLTLSIQSGANGNYTLSVEDNGKGYIINKKFPGHYGVENMRSRAQELKAALFIISEETKGTKVTLIKK
jgi:signal transduction histidine kinase